LNQLRRIPKGAIDRDESHHQAALTAGLVKRRLQKASLTVEDRHEIDRVLAALP